MLKSLESEIKKHGDPQKAEFLKRFFKTGIGQYGENDVFLGLTVPKQRIIAKKYIQLSLADLEKLLESRFHEYRLIALLILMQKYKKSDPSGKKKIANFYLKNTKYINNWDLVDLSAKNILGDYYLNGDKSVVYKLARSGNLWEKRIAVLTCFRFISENEYDDALKIAEMLLKDKHDLIHKAVGWMLREIGKRDIDVEIRFLDKFAETMPRTMLRYSIERLAQSQRKFYLGK